MSDEHNRTEKDFAQYDVGNILWIYLSPILIIVGTVGNILSILVMMRPKFRQTTTMFYLICLSFGDLFTLYTGLLRYWIREAFSVDVRHLSDASCKIHTFLVYLSLDFTVWILVSVTIDRCLSVSLPFKAKRFCSPVNARWVVGIILFLLTLKNMQLLWNLALVHTWEYRCDGKSHDALNFMRYVWPWIDFSTFCLIPFTIMIGCNIKIIHALWRSMKKVNSHIGVYTNSPSSVNHADNSKRPSLCVDYPTADVAQTTMTIGDTLHPEPPKPFNTAHRKSKSGDASGSITSLSVMLLVINCVFLVTTAPIQAFLIGEEYWFPEKNAETIAWYYFWFALVNMLQYVNNAIHFFLYSLSGPRFRNELKIMCRRSRKVGNAT